MNLGSLGSGISIGRGVGRDSASKVWRSGATRTRNTLILVIQSRGSSKNEDLAAHGGIVEVEEFPRVFVRRWENGS